MTNKMLYRVTKGKMCGNQFEQLRKRLALLAALVASLPEVLGAAGAPSITNQPASQTVLQDAPATFIVGADGSTPLYYQWWRDGAVLPGATNASYTLPQAVPADDFAQFRVTVSNSLGVITSAVAVLRVDPGLATPLQTAAISFAHAWKYFPGGEPSANWRERSFDDSSWLTGQGLFGFDPTPAIYPVPFRTLINPPNAGGPATVCFRGYFEFTGQVATATLVVSNLLDDGAVFYLNGAYAGQVRVSAAPGHNHQTAAENQANEGSYDVLNLPVTNLLAGTNVLAVELHQSPISSDDTVFGLSLTVWQTNRVADTFPPQMLWRLPAANQVLVQLFEIEVLFDEPVTNVDAGDLLINGVAATNVEMQTESQYVFTFPQPATGAVVVTWAANHGIRDLAFNPNPFAGGTWSYTLNPNYRREPLRITEFLAANSGGYPNAIRDDDGDYSDWIEIHNAGATTANLDGWFLTDDPANLTKWRFPAVNLAANKYLVIFASSKNRTNINARLHTNFQLAREGEYLALVNPYTNIISEFNPAYPEQSTGVSYGLVPTTTNTFGFFVTPTPEAVNSTSGDGFAPVVQFSRSSSTFVLPFSLVLSVPSTNAQIRYVLGTNDVTPSSTLYTGPISITNTVQVRARAYQTGLLPGEQRSQGFIRLDSATNVVNFVSDLPVVVLHDYGQGAPPTTKPDWFVLAQVFEPKNGVASLTNQPDTAFKGIFHRRGKSTAGYPKGSFSLEAQDDLGNDLEVSLAGLPAESDWVLYAPNRFEPVLIHNPVAHDIYRQMGYYSSRSRMVEVFLQADTGSPGTVTYSHYHGVYVLLERIKIDNNRVDIDQARPENTNSPAITGGYIFSIDQANTGETPFSAAASSINYVDPGYADMSSAAYAPHRSYLVSYFNEFYAALTGANWTNPVTGYAKYIDVTNWVDYHLQNVLTFNVDAFRLSGYFHKPRFDPEKPGSGRITYGPQWDYDRTQGSSDGRDFNPRVWRSPSGDLGTDFFNASGTYANPWFSRLFTDPDFFQLWIDRYQRWRQSVLSTSNLLALIDSRANETRQAQPREAARWAGQGSSNTSPRSGSRTASNYTYVFPSPGTFQGEVDWMKIWYTNRLHFMDTNFVAMPALSHPGGAVSAGQTVTLTGPAGATVVYTLDGSDPRGRGGNFALGIRTNTGPITITNNARIFARAYNASHSNLTGGNGNPPLVSKWSGPVAASYIVATPRLAITELMFDPAPPPAGNTNAAGDFEFIELKNVGAAPINLKDFRFTEGINFTFGTNVPVLAAGQYVVVVKNLAAFSSRYPGVTNVAGEYTGSLDNSGERLRLEGPYFEPILDFAYDSQWFRMTRGNGFSLVIVNENAAFDTWTDAASWRQSSLENGSPGERDPDPQFIPPVYISEILANPNTGQEDAIELFNPNPYEVNVGGWFLSDDFGTPKKFRVSDGTVIPAGGYVVFTAAEFNAGVNGFGLGARGDDAYLFSAVASGRLTGYYHGFDFGASPAGVAFGRLVTSQGDDQLVLQTTTTLGTNNAGPAVGPVVINEIHYHPPALLEDTNWVDNTADEFIELFNASGQPVFLFDPANPSNTWQLRDAVSYVFPTNTMMASNAYLVVVSFDPLTNAANLAAFRSRLGLSNNVPVFGPFQGRLRNSQDSVELVRPGPPSVPAGSSIATAPEYLVDRVQYTNNTPWPCSSGGGGKSLQRLQPLAFGNDPVNWVADVPTPGRATVQQQPGLADIVQQPQSRVVAAGASLTFGVALCGLPPFSYQWYFNDQPLAGETKATLNLFNVQTNHSGNYRVDIANPAGTVPSVAASLIVQTPPFIVASPQSLTVLGYTTASFEVIPGGLAPFQFQWTHNGADIPGATNAVLTLENVQGYQAGAYRARVSNTAGSVLSAPATLTVNLPARVVQPPFDLLTTNGFAVSLVVLATGDGPISYQWYFNSNAIPGATSATLNFTNAQPEEEGYYSVRVTNLYGADISQPAYLTVLTPPVFLEQPPLSQFVTPGTDVTIRAVVGGSRPMAFRWRKNGIEIVPYGLGTETLFLPAVEGAHHGEYTVVATNYIRPSGVLSSRAFVTVVEPPANRSVVEGGSVTFSAKVAGRPTMRYQWYFNSNAIAGATSTNLTISNAQLTNAGLYTFWTSLSNLYVNQSAEYSATLTVQTTPTPPQIVQQPANRYVSPGQTALFSVAAAGTDPLFYQWWFNGTNLLAGSTNAVLILANTSSNHLGGYSVVVSNFLGSVTSAVALLAPPASGDTDGDGLPDDWELAHGLNPNQPNADLDSDGDGLTNGQEYLAGTNPTNAASVLKLEARPLTGGDSTALHFEAVSNRSYTIQFRNGLSSGPWQRYLDVPPAPTNRPIGVTNAGTNLLQFYRLATPMTP